MKALLTILVLFLYVPITQAAWVNSGIGQITYVRTYQVGQDGLRVQVGISGATHDCGNTPNTFYFDSNKIPIDVVKAVLSLSFGAFAAGKSVYVTYDCSFGGGYGWGVGISVTK